MIRLFRHYVPRGLLLLALVEALIFFFSVYVGKALTNISYNVELNGLAVSEAIAAYWEKPSVLVLTSIVAP